MINDLDTNAQQWKYVDDTTVSEVVVKGGESHELFLTSALVLSKWESLTGGRLSVFSKTSQAHEASD